VFEYARPGTLEETVALLGAVPGARLLSGGTDLLVGVRKGTLRAALVVDLKRVGDLQPGIEERDGALSVAATTPLSAVIADERVRARFPALVAAAQVVGSIQIRNRATLAGNICNASPAADTATPLLAYGALITIHGPSGSRRVPLDDFFLAPGRTVLGADEVVTAVQLPLPSRPLGAAFGRMTRRRGVDLATVNLCCSVAADGVTRFAFGAVGPRPFTATDATGTLATSNDPGEVDLLLRELTGRATPISNVRASREYRAEMLVVLARRALAEARAELDTRGH
jgi:carbon-monoxide dehydrogenase medium subunit